MGWPESSLYFLVFGLIVLVFGLFVQHLILRESFRQFRACYPAQLSLTEPILPLYGIPGYLKNLRIWQSGSSFYGGLPAVLDGAVGLPVSGYCYLSAS